MKTPEKEPIKTKKRISPTLIILGIIALLVVLAVTSLPRAFPTDFSIVGKGSNAVVLMYDPNILQSGETTSAMNEVRDEYAGQIEFVVVQIGTPTGSLLSRRYDLKTAALLFFDGSGKMLKIVHSAQDAASLRHNFNEIF